MKKLLLAGIVALFAVTSCSTVKNGKMAQSQRKEFLQLKGDWEITSIVYDKSYKIKPFGENVDADCFVGSHWRFIPNNYSGSYTLNGGGNCPSIIQPIKIDENSQNQFLFKKLQDGVKAKNVADGYALDIVNQATDQFSLQQNIPFEGENVQVTYNFQRTGMK